MEKEEYEGRRIQLINSLTKTTHTKEPQQQPQQQAPSAAEPRLVGTERVCSSTEFTNGLLLNILQAIRHRYDVKKGKWCHTATIVIVEQTPFAEGAMRKAFRMRDLSQVSSLPFITTSLPYGNLCGRKSIITTTYGLFAGGTTITHGC